MTFKMHQPKPLKPIVKTMTMYKFYGTTLAKNELQVRADGAMTTRYFNSSRQRSSTGWARPERADEDFTVARWVKTFTDLGFKEYD